MAPKLMLLGINTYTADSLLRGKLLQFVANLSCFQVRIPSSSQDSLNMSKCLKF